MSAFMTYSLLVTVLLSTAAWLTERLLTLAGRPRRGPWAAALLFSLLIPAWQVTHVRYTATGSSLLQFDLADEPIVAQPAQVVTRDGAMRPGRATPALRISGSPASRRWLLGAWLTSSAVLLLAGACGWLRLRGASRSWRSTLIDGERVYVAERLGPAVAGFLRPVIVLPRWLIEAPPTARAPALAHERQHIAARDPLLWLAGLLCVTAAPWNLPLWWQVRRLRFAIEADCDARVLCGGAAAQPYAEMLLWVGQRSTSMSLATLAMIEPMSQLERRIRLLVPAPRRWVAGSAVLCLMGIATLVMAAGRMAAPATFETQALRLPAMWEAQIPPLVRNVEERARQQYPQFFSGSLTDSIQITACLASDGAVRSLTSEISGVDVLSAAAGKQRMDQCLAADATSASRKLSVRSTMLRLRNDGPRHVDMLVIVPAIDRGDAAAIIEPAVRARYPEFYAGAANQQSLVTVVMNDDGTIRDSRGTIVPAGEKLDRADFPVMQHFAALGLPLAEIGRVGVMGATGSQGGHLVEFAWPKSAGDFFVISPGEESGVQRQLVERHFPELLGKGSHPHELPWILLSAEGVVLSSGYSTQTLPQLTQSLSSADPALRVADGRVVRLRKLFDDVGTDDRGEPLMLAFLWTDALRAPAATGVTHGPDVTLEAALLRDGVSLDSRPLSLSFDRPEIAAWPQMRLTVRALPNGSGNVVLRMIMDVPSGAVDEYADAWRMVAQPAVVANYDGEATVQFTAPEGVTAERHVWTLRLHPHRVAARASGAAG